MLSSKSNNGIFCILLLITITSTFAVKSIKKSSGAVAAPPPTTTTTTTPAPEADETMAILGIPESEGHEGDSQDMKDVDINIAIDHITTSPATPKPVKDAFDKINQIGDGGGAQVISDALLKVKDTTAPGFDMLFEFITNIKIVIGGAGVAPDIKKDLTKCVTDILGYIVKAKAKLVVELKAAISAVTSVVVKMGAEVLKFAEFLKKGFMSILVLVDKTIVFKFSMSARILKETLNKLLVMLNAKHSGILDACENILEENQGSKIGLLQSLRLLIGFATEGVHPLISHLVNTLSTVGALLGKPLTIILSATFEVALGISLNVGAGGAVSGGGSIKM